MKLQVKVLKYLKAQPDTWCVNIEVAKRGTADIIYFSKGLSGVVEIKDRGDTPKILQYEQLCKVAETGNASCIVALDFDIARIQRKLNKFEIDRKKQSFNKVTMIPVISFEEFQKEFEAAGGKVIAVRSIEDVEKL